MFSTRLMAVTAVILFALGTVSNASADSILALEDFHFSETFGDNQAMSGQGWFAYFDSGAGTVDRSDILSLSYNVEMKNSYLIGCVEGTSMTVDDYGCVLFQSKTSSGTVGLLGSCDNVSEVDLEDYTGITFSWKQWSVNSPSVASRVALQIDSTWYVSADLISNPSADGSNNAGGGIVHLTGGEDKTFVIDSQTQWYTLSSFTLGTDAAPGDAMTVGTTSVSLPATGAINGVGLYGIVPSTGSGIYLGFDNFEVTGTAVPEPSTVAMLLAAGLVLPLLRRRKK